MSRDVDNLIECEKCQERFTDFTESSGEIHYGCDDGLKNAIVKLYHCPKC